MSQENLRAALVAAASMYPEGYGALRDLAAITSTQTAQLIFDRAEELAIWLDQKEAGESPTARTVLAAGDALRRPPVEWDSPEQKLAYVDWIEANALRDSVTSQYAFRETLGR